MQEIAMPRTVFSQLLDYLPSRHFRRCVNRYQGDKRLHTFSSMDQFICMAFAQLSYRESLRDIEATLRAVQPKLYHMGIRGKVSRSTLADANERRDWRIYADLAQPLIRRARALYADEKLAVDLDATAYALDTTAIDLSLSLFPWAKFTRQYGSLRLHTQMDLRGRIPTFISITDGKSQDKRLLDILPLEAGAFYIMDRGFVDYSRMHRIHRAGAFFILRAGKNARTTRIYSRPIDKNIGLRTDQTVSFVDYCSKKRYPDHLRRINYTDPESKTRFVWLTNNFELSSETIPELYRLRWSIEVFFKWIKQNLRIKAFYGTSANAVKTQIWISITVYLLVAILKKDLNLDHSLMTILQILSVTLFEESPILQVLNANQDWSKIGPFGNQLELFNS